MKFCVFLGSSSGCDVQYAAAARKLGNHLALSGIGLVYGGASIGLMGELARSCTDAGGDVIGIIPERIAEIEMKAEFISELIYVDTLAEREELMFQYSDGFIAIPGGVGTLEEIFTVSTWNALKYHDKPLGMLNTNRYYDGLLDFLKFQSEQGFVSQNWIDSLIVDERVTRLVERMVRACSSDDQDAESNPRRRAASSAQS